MLNALKAVFKNEQWYVADIAVNHGLPSLLIPSEKNAMCIFSGSPTHNINLADSMKKS